MWTPEDLLIYDRESGYAAYVPSIRSRSWEKPLYAQITVTEKCDLACSFCYANSSPCKSRMWRVEDLMELVKFLGSWGLFGFALGGGEPFMHPNLAEIVKKTWSETGLDVSITTNGLLQFFPARPSLDLLSSPAVGADAYLTLTRLKAGDSSRMRVVHPLGVPSPG